MPAPTPDQIREAVTQGLAQHAIAKQHGVSKDTIGALMRQHDITPAGRNRGPLSNPDQLRALADEAARDGITPTARRHHLRRDSLYNALVRSGLYRGPGAISLPPAVPSDRAPDLEGAACTTHDPELFFPGPSDTAQARAAAAVCADCPVTTACRQWAQASPGGAWGVFGGIWWRNGSPYPVARKQDAA